MKSQLIIVNWLLSLLLLTYNGNSLILTFIVASNFSLACYLLLHNKKNIAAEIKRMDRKIDRLIRKYEVNSKLE